MNELFTVIIVTYNHKEYLYDCISSVLIQDYPFIEIIISDDASSEFDVISLEKYIEDNKKSNLINYVINANKENVGPVKNLNTAIKLGSGRYFINLDGDDMFYDSTVLSSRVEFYKKTDYLAITGISQFFNREMKNPFQVYPHYSVINYMLTTEPIEIYKKLCKGNFLSGPGFSYKRELLEKYGLYDESYKVIGDYSRYLYLTKNGCKIGMTEKFIIKYRHGVGVWTSHKDKHIKDMIEQDLLLMKNSSLIQL